MVKLPSLVAFAKSVCGVCLGGLILWQVAQHSGASRSTVIVHVSKAHVVVSVDDRDYPINSMRELPLLCELRSGRHTLCMKQGGRVVYKEVFSVKPGEELVLTAWEPPSDSPFYPTPEMAGVIDKPSGVDVTTGDGR